MRKDLKTLGEKGRRKEEPLLASFYLCIRHCMHSDSGLCWRPDGEDTVAVVVHVRTAAYPPWPCIGKYICMHAGPAASPDDQPRRQRLPRSWSSRPQGEWNDHALIAVQQKQRRQASCSLVLGQNCRISGARLADWLVTVQGPRPHSVLDSISKSEEDSTAPNEIPPVSRTPSDPY